MFETAEADLWFGTPLARFMVEDHTRLNTDLLAEGARLRGQNKGVQKSNRGGLALARQHL